MKSRLIVSEVTLRLLPQRVTKAYEKWALYMEERVEFSLKSSVIHTRQHAERVLLFALLIAEKRKLSEQSLEALAHASIFHDTRRWDDSCDVGHGARGAKHYKNFCNSHGDLTFHETAYLAMIFHD